tara:strand:+ start:242 stop:1012 length:771 start_codon:yes stop_codon:yes gene_type:complete
MGWTAPRNWSDISAGIVTASSLNTDVRDNMLVLSTHAHTGAAGMGASSMTGLTLAALATLTFADQSANPDAAGELQRNGNDLLWYGASLVNLSAADASAGTASLRSLGTTSVKAAAGNHGHSFEDLTAGTNDTDSTYLGGSESAGAMTSQIATSGTKDTDLTHAPTTYVALVATASFVLQGHTQPADYTVSLWIDGTQVATASGTAGITNALVIHLSGMREKASGSYTIRARIVNTDSGDVLRGGAALHAFSVTAS